MGISDFSRSNRSLPNRKLGLCNRSLQVLESVRGKQPDYSVGVSYRCDLRNGNIAGEIFPDWGLNRCKSASSRVSD